LTRSTLILIPALLAWSGTAVAGVSSRAARHIAGKDRHFDQACVETRAIVSAIGKELYYGKSIFVDGPPTRPEHIIDAASVNARTVPLTVDSPEWMNGWTGATPPTALVSAWLAEPPKSAATCIEHSPGGNVQMISEEDAAKIRGNASPGHPSDAFLIRVGAPVIDAHKRHALLLYASEGLSIGGRVQFYHLEQKGGKWIVVGQRILTVS